MISQVKKDYDESILLSEKIAELCGWLDQQALPLWLGPGFDQNLGLFYERLNFDGQPIVGLPRRLLVQCRQISVYAHATLRGRLNEKEKLRALYENIRYHYLSKNDRGHWYYSINDNGMPHNCKVESYTLTFVLFALGWLYRLDPNDSYLSDVDDIFSILEGSLAAKDGGVSIELSNEQKFLSQNPNMHLLEACLNFYEAAGRIKDFDRARSIVRLLTKKILDKKFRAIPEIHLESWKIYEPSKNWFEPGHHFEWSWLLRQFERLGGANCSSIIKKLSQRALTEGLDHSSKVIEQVGLQKNFKITSSRNWGLCEYLKFCSNEYQEALWRSDNFEENLWRSRTLSSLENLKDAYLSTKIKGLWNDRLSKFGLPLTDHVPASSFYHIYFAISEVERIFTRYVPKKPIYISKQKALFLDRDGVINFDVQYANKPEQIVFVPGIFNLVRKAKVKGHKVIVITNQSGIARSYFSEKDVIALHKWMAEKFEEQGGSIDAFYHCAYLGGVSSTNFNIENHFDRKPSPGMIKRSALEWNLSLEKSILVGDKLSDISAAKRIGMRAYFIESDKRIPLKLIKFIE